MNQRFQDTLDELRAVAKAETKELVKGLLAPIRERVLADRSLCLEIREDYLNIYYRGGNLLKLSTATSGYVAFFDTEYAEGDGGALSRALPAVARGR